MFQRAPFYTTNILVLTAWNLSESNNPLFFSFLIISINFSIRKAFYFILDEIAYYICFNALQLIVFFCCFLIHCWYNLCAFFHVFFLFLFVFFRHILFAFFSILVQFMLFFFSHILISISLILSVLIASRFLIFLCFLHNTVYFFLGTFLCFFFHDFTISLLTSHSLF